MHKHMLSPHEKKKPNTSTLHLFKALRNIDIEAKEINETNSEISNLDLIKSKKEYAVSKCLLCK